MDDRTVFEAKHDYNGMRFGVSKDKSFTIACRLVLKANIAQQ